ncbi:hypothetical protein [Petroclostridium sp. X23]|nr:hypothetical protein [Petroclostridium sp. X23]WHH58279.1 hypothetical protein QKW49_21145 [Petroclostridium sp. X23]
MELKVKLRLRTGEDMEELIKMIEKIEKEHSCNCTLLEIEIG